MSYETMTIEQLEAESAKCEAERAAAKEKHQKVADMLKAKREEKEAIEYVERLKLTPAKIKALSQRIAVKPIEAGGKAAGPSLKG